MKICLLLAGDEEGGLEQHFVELSNGLSKHHDVIVIAHQKYQSRFLEKVTVESLDLSKSRMNPRTLWSIWRLINHHQPDIVHAHANKAASMLANIRFFIKAKRIATIHNQKKNVQMFEKMDLVIGVSKSVLKNIKNKASTVIYNGVDKKKLLVGNQTPAINFQSFASKPIVISVGRLVPAKGMDVLIQAWKNIDAHLLILGDGPENDHLKKLTASLGLNETIHFLGFRKDVGAILKKADLVVIGSRKEGFSYVCAEALLTETVVISTDVPVANEILPKKYIVDIENIEQLHGLVKSSLSQMTSVIEDFKPIFNIAENEFTFESMLSKTMAAYKNCLEQ